MKTILGSNEDRRRRVAGKVFGIVLVLMFGMAVWAIGATTLSVSGTTQSARQTAQLAGIDLATISHVVDGGVSSASLRPHLGLLFVVLGVPSLAAGLCWCILTWRGRSLTSASGV